MIWFGADGGKGLICKKDTMFVSDLDINASTSNGGIYIAKDQMLNNQNFMRPRWARVRYKADNLDNIEVGDWVLLRHGHWSTSIRITIDDVDTRLWYIDPKSFKEGLVAVSKEKPYHIK